VTEILIRKSRPPVDWLGVPAQYIGKASAVCRTLRDCEELVKWFGDENFCPFLPVLVAAPGGWTAIAGYGYASAAELQDCAIVLWTRQAEALAKTGRLMDFDELRDRHGLMRKEDVPQAMAEALEARIRRHKANPITDPFDEPTYPNPTARAQFLVDGTRDGFISRTEETPETGLHEADRAVRPARPGNTSEGTA
jgi:hypothetical protein